MRYRTILCASDGLAHSRRALRRAVEMAREAGAELHVVHVPEPAPDVARSCASDCVEAMRGERLQAIRSQLHEWSDGELPLMAIPHFLRGAGGPVAERIAHLAERLDADVIVIGSRPRGVLDAAPVDSTSQRLLRLTRRPVFVFAGDAASSTVEAWPAPRATRIAR